MAAEEIASLLWNSLDILIIPSPVLAEDGAIFPDIDPANGLYVGGRARLEAAVELSSRYAPGLIVVVGGIHPKHGARMTAAMRQFIVKRNRRANVLPVDSLPCTRHNVIALFNQLGQQLADKRLAVLTNEYHLPRFLAFWSKLRAEYRLRIDDPLPIAAEVICDPGDAQAHAAAIKARHAAEQRGLADLRAGKYADRCLRQLPSFQHELAQHAHLYLSPDELMKI